jgi:site-specific recombinase XerC
MAGACDTTTAIGLRDRAVILLGFAGAFRRSDLVGIEVRHLSFSADGVRIALFRSKGDQEGAG